MAVKEMTSIRDIKPSKIACAIVFISRSEESVAMKMNYNGWCKELESLTGYSQSDLSEAVERFRSKIIYKDKQPPSFGSEKKLRNKENQNGKSSPRISSGKSSVPNSNSKFPNPPNSIFTNAGRP